MAVHEDILIKSVLFGGFDKNEVLAYIEKIQSEHYDESETIKRKDEEIERLKEKAAQFEDKLASENRRFSALAALNDEYCEKIYNLEEQMKEQCARFDSIQDDCDRLKKVESQIGALLVDAVLYSDKMTEKAKTAANNITADAKGALVSTAQGVSELSSEIVQISSGFSNDIKTLVEKVESLSANLSLFADRFESECDVSREKAYDAQEVFEHFFAQSSDTEKDMSEDDLSENKELEQQGAESDSLKREDLVVSEDLEELDATEESEELEELRAPEELEELRAPEELEAPEEPEELEELEALGELEVLEEPLELGTPEELVELEEPEELVELEVSEEPLELDAPEELVELEAPKAPEELDAPKAPEELEAPEEPEELGELEVSEEPLELDTLEELEGENTAFDTKEVNAGSSRDVSESDIDELLRLFSNETGMTNG